MKRTTINLPDEVAELVNLEARRRHTSFSEVVRQLVLKSLSAPSERPREIPWAGLYSDPDTLPAERLDEALSERWADDIDRDRG
jgi:Arc/MetJ-type ribon-helix-helix transcriptional regulator